jgi:hypothetical protein
MSSPRAEQLKSILGFENWPDTDVGSDRLFVWNFRATDGDVDDWHIVSQRRACLPSGVCVGRSSWQRTVDPIGQLLLIDSYECRSRAQARETVIDLLAHFQLPRPFEMSEQSTAGIELVDSDGANSLVVIGNLVVRVASGSQAPSPTTAISQELSTRLATRPEVTTRKRMVAPQRRSLRVAEPFRLDVPFEPAARRLDTPDSSTYLKVFTRQGEAQAVDDAIVYTPTASGAEEVECYSVRPKGADFVRYAFDVRAGS